MSGARGARTRLGRATGRADPDGGAVDRRHATPPGPVGRRRPRRHRAPPPRRGAVTRARSIATGVGAPGRADIPARTLRTDRWWQAPVTTVVLLSAWVIYAVVRTASQRAFYVAKDHYLSPFTSPCVTSSCPQAARDFGTWFGHFPPFIPLAILVLPFLLGFRLTCY